MVNKATTVFYGKMYPPLSCTPREVYCLFCFFPIPVHFFIEPMTPLECTKKLLHGELHITYKVQVLKNTRQYMKSTERFAPCGQVLQGIVYKRIRNFTNLSFYAGALSCTPQKIVVDSRGTSFCKIRYINRIQEFYFYCNVNSISLLKQLGKLLQFVEGTHTAKDANFFEN